MDWEVPGRTCEEASVRGEGDSMFVMGEWFGGSVFMEMTYLLDVVDEEICDGNLGPHIAKLRGNAPEQNVLLVERLVHVSRIEVSTLLLAVGHVRVCDLRDGREEEHHRKKEYEARDRKVGILHRRQGRVVDVLEEHLSREKRRDNAANGLERLGEIQAQFGISRRSARRNVWVCRGFEGRQARPDDEHAADKSAERPLDAGGPEHQRSNAEDAETGDEGPSIAVPSNNPSSICQRSEEVSAKVSSGESSTLRFGDPQGCLEVGVPSTIQLIPYTNSGASIANKTSSNP